ncbi:hypothetical protein L0156_00900 [bacterium]|nr:hypothetical protein [bacterium]
MISKLNNSSTNIKNVSRQDINDIFISPAREAAAPELQKDMEPKSSQEKNAPDTNLNPKALQDIAADKKGMGSIEAALRRADIENNYLQAVQQNTTEPPFPETESLELENTLVSNVKEQQKPKENENNIIAILYA